MWRLGLHAGLQEPIFHWGVRTGCGVYAGPVFSLNISHFARLARLGARHFARIACGWASPHLGNRCLNAFDQTATTTDHFATFSANGMAACAGLVEGSPLYVTPKDSGNLGSTWWRYSLSAVAPLKHTSRMPG